MDNNREDYIKEKRKELQDKLKEDIKKAFKKYDDDLYGFYVTQEKKDEYWLDHYHICSKAMIRSSLMFPDDKNKHGKKILKGFKKDCEDYLISQGKEKDDCLTCCDECPYMKFVVVDDNQNIMVVL